MQRISVGSHDTIRDPNAILCLACRWHSSEKGKPLCQHCREDAEEIRAHLYEKIRRFEEVFKTPFSPPDGIRSFDVDVSELVVGVEEIIIRELCIGGNPSYRGYSDIGRALYREGLLKPLPGCQCLLRLPCQAKIHLGEDLPVKIHEIIKTIGSKRLGVTVESASKAIKALLEEYGAI